MTKVSLTGRLTKPEPQIQNVPGSLADKLMWYFERGGK